MASGKRKSLSILFHFNSRNQTLLQERSYSIHELEPAGTYAYSVLSLRHHGFALCCVCLYMSQQIQQASTAPLHTMRMDGGARSCCCCSWRSRRRKDLASLPDLPLPRPVPRGRLLLQREDGQVRIARVQRACLLLLPRRSGLRAKWSWSVRQVRGRSRPPLRQREMGPRVH